MIIIKKIHILLLKKKKYFVEEKKKYSRVGDKCEGANGI
jgi:hypothetical protein